MGHESVVHPLFDATVGPYCFSYYNPVIGTFISPRPAGPRLVPDPTSVWDYNRFLYARGNPMRYTDPSGFDPLDAAWEAEWRANHCPPGNPTCEVPNSARQDRLYSLVYLGPVSHLQTWTSDDWTYLYYYHDKVYYSTVERASLSNFTAAINRLASYYASDEKSQFVSAIALLYAGWPYDPTGGNISDMMFAFHHIDVGANMRYYVNHGMSGFASAYHNNGAENTHHFAGHLLLGYH